MGLRAPTATVERTHGQRRGCALYAAARVVYDRLPMKIERHHFGKTDIDEPVDLFTLKNTNGLTVRFANYGGRITEILVPDRAGRFANVALGYDALAPYVDQNPYFGAIVGRFANRIADGRFVIDAYPYETPRNNGANTLHGGLLGFDRRVWEASEVDVPGGRGVRLFYHSPNMEEGFPGNLDVTVTYALLDNNEFRIDYLATTDRPTPVNLSNHTYFNLKGAGNGTVLDHALRLHASHYTPVDESLIPTGEIRAVAGTPMDFTTPHKIGSRLADVRGGYDHNYVLDGRNAGQLTDCARLEEETTGRVLEIRTTEPGVQFYSGNFLDGSITGPGGAYVKHGGLCLETQHFPDSVNQPTFPNTVLRPGEEYRQTTTWRFSTLP
jgi:aldose 1-epimerase